VKQDKTRKDFYLDEGYEAYRAFHAFNSFLQEMKASTEDKNKLLKLADTILDCGYQNGYASAEFDAAERS